MLNALLLEVECKKKGPKGPDPAGPAAPTQASPVELTRATVALLGRRHDYSNAVAKYQDLVQKLAKAKAKDKAKIDHDLACAKLSLAASENWVKFGVQRWKLLADFAGKNGIQSGKLTNVLNYGNAQAKLAGDHLDAVAQKKPVPSIDDLVLKDGKLHKDGKPFSFSDTVEPVKAEPKVAEPVAVVQPEPEPVEDPEIAAKAAASHADAKKSAAKPAPYIGLSKGSFGGLAAAGKADELVGQYGTDDAAKWQAVAALMDYIEVQLGQPPQIKTDVEQFVVDAIERKKQKDAAEKAKTIETLTYEQRVAVYSKGKELVTAALKATGEYPSSSPTFETLVPLIFGPEYAQVGKLSPDAAGQILNELDKVRSDTRLMDEDVVDAQKIADEVTASVASSGIPQPDYAKLISQEISKKLGKWVPYTTMVDLTKNAIDKGGASYSSLTMSERVLGTAAVAAEQMSNAWENGIWPPLPVHPDDVQKTFSIAANIQISKAAAEVISAAVYDNLDQVDKLDTLLSSTVDLLVKYTAENLASGMLLPEAVKSAAAKTGVLTNTVLSASVRFDIHQKVIAAHTAAKKQPDELGFLAGFKTILSKSTLSTEKWGDFGDGAVADTAWGDLQSLASAYNIANVGTFFEKLEQLVVEVKIKKFDAPGFAAACYAVWDQKAKTVLPDMDLFSDHIITVLDYNTVYGLSLEAAQALGAAGKWTYTHDLYISWLTKWNEAQAKLTAPPPVVTAPVVGAAPTAAPPPKPSLPPGYDYFYSKKGYKKLSKPEHLSDGMFIYLANKCVAAIEGGTLLTTKGEVGPKKVASAVSAIHASFKNDWATAGITQIGKALVDEFMKNTLDVLNQNLVMVGSPNFYSTLLDKYGKSYIAVNAKLGMSASLVAAQPKVNTPAGATLQDIPALLTALMANPNGLLSQWEIDNVEDIWNKTVGAGHTFVPPNGTLHVFSKGQHDALQVFLTKAKNLLPAGPGVAPIASAQPSTATAPGKLFTVPVDFKNAPLLFVAMKKHAPTALTGWDYSDLADTWNVVDADENHLIPSNQVHVAKFLAAAKPHLQNAAGDLKMTAADIGDYVKDAEALGFKNVVSKIHTFNPTATTAPVSPAVDHFTFDNIPPLLALMKAQFPDDLDDWESSSGQLELWVKKHVEQTHTIPDNIKTYFQDFLDKAKDKLPNWTPTGVSAAPAPAAPAPQVGVTLEITPTAPASTYQALGVGPRANPLGMTYEEIAAFASLDKPASSPEMPAGTEDWKNKYSFFGGDTAGGSEKWSIGIDVDGEVTDLTFGTTPKAHGAWMHKPEKASFRAYGEVASNRVQMMLGFVGTPDAWTKTFKGQFGSVQKFDRAPANFRKNHTEDAPWTEGESAVEELQKYFVLNYITSESDDHGGNFAIMPDGKLKGLDRAQAFKFFDSSHSALDYLKLGDEIPFPAYAQQNDTKGMPVKTLKHWANGGSISLMPLTFPSFEAMIARAEAIPSDLYKAMWKPYAEAAAKEKYPSHPYPTGNPALGEASTVPADKTVEGFLEGANNRRKNVRASIGAMYAALAKTRAQSLKTKGDARPLAEIESEIRDQLGLDAFLQGTKPAKEVSPVSQADPAPPTTSDEAWSPSNPTAMGKVPSAEILAKNGSDGFDMIAGGKDAKGGLVQFWQVGENPFSLIYLDARARTKLEAKLPHVSAQGPTPPVKPTFTPKALPSDMVSNEPKSTLDLWRDVMAASGVSSSQMHPVTTETTLAGQPITKAEKYLDKWAKGEDIGGNISKVCESVAKANAMALSGDPLMKAAGLHYQAEFQRVGSGDYYTYTLKPSSGFSEADKKIKPFVPTAEVLQAQAAAKAANANAVAQAQKIANDYNAAEQKKIDDRFAEDMAKYTTAKAEFDALSASNNKLPATKLTYWPVPKDVKREALQANMGGQDLVSKKSKWAGEYGTGYDFSGGSYGSHSSEQSNPVGSYEIDLTDAVTGSSAGADPTKRLIVHFVHTQLKSDEERVAAGRMGSLRIQYPAGSTSAQIKEYTRKTYAHLGLDLSPASEEENELSYLRTMAWLRKIEGYKAPSGLTVEESEPDGPTSAKINFWIEQFKKPPTEPNSPGAYGWSESAGGLGHDPRYLPLMDTSKKPKKNTFGEVLYEIGPDGKPKKNPFYQPIAIEYDGAGSAGFRRFDITDAEMDALIASGRSLYKTSSALRNKRTTMHNTGSMYSSERRNNMGFMPHGNNLYPGLANDPKNMVQRWGTSPGQDVPTGGSGTIYLYVDKNKPHHNAFVEISPKIMLFTPVFSHHSDSYGAKNDYESGKDSTKRAGSVQESDLLEALKNPISQSAETLIQNKLSWTKWAVKIYPLPGQRQKWIDSYKAAGITHMGIDNKPIEEVIGEERD